MIDAARRWREMRVPFRLGLDADAPSKGAMTLIEWRLSATRWTDPRWSGGCDEPGVCVMRVRLAAADGRLDVVPTPWVNLGLHALARWYQRSGQRDHEALLRDCVPLVTGRDVDRVEAGAGYWKGGIVVADDEAKRSYRVRDVRTYTLTPAEPPGRAAKAPAPRAA